ncbi:MAG TPA: quinolinate synthase NadA [Deltaproteobacteria bacterium]|nr:quinolinate synthase NadA [Deltaproteobacteria bacterium]HQI80976.1 quinolinate synthase NadA [Deltaproteobacteria bacterium]
MDIVSEIMSLKKARDAVILAHNYQLPEVQDIADFVGDSLGLSIQAAGTNAKVIVFCGVHFMAETAKVLSPGKTVLLPDMDSGCPMADMVTAENVLALREQYPDATVLCYVNTSAEVKAVCDLCCTSANAESMVRDIMNRGGRVIFVPDRHLAGYAAEATGCDIIPWKGFCPTHVKILPEHVTAARGLHPDAVVLAHPECTSEVRHLADKVLSTEAMCSYATEMKAQEFIVATEIGILHRMRADNPAKRFHPASELAVCPNMKRNTLEKVLHALQSMRHEITLERETMHGARQCIRRMLEYRA